MTTRDGRDIFRKEIRATLEAARKRVANALGVRYLPLLAFDRGLDSDLEQHIARAASSEDLDTLKTQAVHAIMMAELCVATGQEEYRWLTGAIFAGGNFAKYAAMSEQEAQRGPRPRSAADARADERRAADVNHAGFYARITDGDREFKRRQEEALRYPRLEVSEEERRAVFASMLKDDGGQP